MKILHVVPSYFPAARYGGTIWSVHGLCRGLTDRGHAVHVYTTSVDGSKNSAVPVGVDVSIDGVRVIYFRSIFLRRLYWSWGMAEALKHNLRDFDLVHLHSIFLWPGWAAANVAKRKGIPYILSPRGMLVQDMVLKKSSFIKKAWISLIEKKNLENASTIHFTSDKEQEEAKRFGIHFKKTLVIPNGCDIGPNSIETNFLRDSVLESQIRELAARGPFILFLGRISWKKGLDRLIKAMTYTTGANLVITGNDEENYRPNLEALASREGVAQRVTFIGPVYGQAKEILLRSAVFFVLPSYSENFGNSVLEAMAVGCPVVVTPEVGLASTVKEVGAGLVVEGDPVSLGKGMASIVADPTRLKKMGIAGQNLVRERFSWNKIAADMEAAYEEILCSRK